ncbi:hypothetical protein WCLP8_350005 [uncultured Gammaproteobacteria bacterium]
MTAIKNRLNEGHNGYVHLTANDIFLSLLQQKKSMPPASELTMAVFSIKLAGIKKARSLTIQPPNPAWGMNSPDPIFFCELTEKMGDWGGPPDGLGR